MKHIKNFINFINEGARWYESYIDDKDNKKGRVTLSIKNDPNNPNELLKTPYLTGENYTEKGLAGIKVYYGLHPRDPYKSNQQISKDTKDFLMDTLKEANPEDFKMENGETLGDFIYETGLKNIKRSPNYIVRMGSSKRLVGYMAKALSIRYPEAKIIDISKIEYFNPRDVIDEEALQRAIDRELSIERKDDEGNKIEPYSTTLPRVESYLKKSAAELKRIIERTGIPNPSFHLRSSGVMGSIRSVFKPKYNTAEQSFVDAVNHCVLGDEEGYTATMIIIDDNTQHGIDFSNISNKIVEILADIIDISKNTSEEFLKNSGIFDKLKDNYVAKRELMNVINKDTDIESIKNKIKSNIIGYVLYNFSPTKSERNIESEVVVKLSKKRRMEIGKNVYDTILSLRKIDNYKYIEKSQPLAISKISTDTNINNRDLIKQYYKEYLESNGLLNSLNYRDKI